MSSSFDKLIRSGRKTPLFVKDERWDSVSLGQRDIERMIPHRHPFLLVDSISAVNTRIGAVLGHRTIDDHDPVLRGHFPGDPVYPGVLLVETMAQLSLCLQHLLTTGRPDLTRDDAPTPGVRLLKVHHAVFLAEARPGDRLTVLSKMVEDNGYTAIMAGQVMRERTICAVAVLEAYLLGQ